MKYLYRIFFVAVIFNISLLNPVFAENITVSPAIIEQTVVPGTNYNFTINVTNNESSGSGLFYLDTHNIKNVTEFGEPIFAENEGEKTGFEMSSWVNLDSSTLRVKTGQTRQASFSVNVPKNASPGWHAGAIFVGNNPTSEGGNNASLIDYKTAVIISLRVAGDVSDELQINKFSTGKYINFDPNINFDVTLENTGNALERPAGTIELTDYQGTKVASIDINEKRSAVTPGNLRVLSSSWTGNGWAIGRYKASLALSYGAENSYKTATRQTYFWILPGKIILGVTSTLLILALVIFVLVRVYIKVRIKSITNVDVVRTTSIKKASKLIVMTLTSLAFSIIFAVILFIIFS